VVTGCQNPFYPAPVTYPSPPWQMNAQMWLSVFRVRDTGRQDRPPPPRPPARPTVSGRSHA